MQCFSKRDSDTGEKQETARDYAILRERYEQLFTAYQELFQAHEEILREKETLRAECDTMHTKHEALQGKHETLQGKHETLQGKHETLHTEHKAFVAQHESMCRKYEKRLGDLEDKINKNSKNSSKPPSTDIKANLESKPGRRKGATHSHRRRELLPEKWVTGKERLCHTHCKRCGASTEETGNIAVHQQVDVQEDSLALDLTQWELVETRCTQCDCTHKPTLDSHQRFALGPRLEALIQEMMEQMPLSHRKVRAFLQKICPDLKVSQGLIAKIKSRGAKAMAQAAAEIQQAMGSKGESVQADCTGWRHKGTNHHLFVACTDRLACFRILRRQNQHTIAEILGDRKIHIVCDRGLPIQRLFLRSIQYCLPHLMRNIQGLSEKKSTSVKEATMLGELYEALRELFVEQHRHKAGKISKKTWKAYGRRSWRFIQDLIEEALIKPVSDKVENFLHRLLKDLKHFKTYLTRDGPMTNNAAERALRPAVISRKLSFGTCSDYGLEWRERMLSFCHTLRRNGCNAWHFLAKTVKAYRLSLAPPSILEAISF